MRRSAPIRSAGPCPRTMTSGGHRVRCLSFSGVFVRVGRVGVPTVRASRSAFAQHCVWLSRKVPAAYVRAYWSRARRLPALAHLHMLYGETHPGRRNPRLPHGSVPDRDRGPVSLPSELCVCDCPVQDGNGTQFGVLMLASMCVTEAFEWQTCTAAELVVRVPGFDLRSATWLLDKSTPPSRPLTCQSGGGLAVTNNGPGLLLRNGRPGDPIDPGGSRPPVP